MDLDAVALRPNGFHDDPRWGTMLWRIANKSGSKAWFNMISVEQGLIRCLGQRFCDVLYRRENARQGADIGLGMKQEVISWDIRWLDVNRPFLLTPDPVFLTLSFDDLIINDSFEDQTLYKGALLCGFVKWLAVASKICKASRACWNEGNWTTFKGFTSTKR